MPVMTVKKLSVSLRADVADAVARVAAREGVSVSTWLNEAAEHAIRIADGRAAVRAHFAEHGEPSDADRARALEIIHRLRLDEPLK